MRAFQESFLPKARNNASSRAPSINKAVVYIISRWETLPTSRRLPACGETRISRLRSPRELPSSVTSRGCRRVGKVHKKFRRDFAPHVASASENPSFPPTRRGCSRFRDNGENVIRERGNTPDYRADDIPAWRHDKRRVCRCATTISYAYACGICTYTTF